MKKYEWVIVGGGIAGIAVSEILVREGHSVLLIEKNEKLASETTRELHEWIHTGSLYTIIPDKLVTLKYIIGAIDDLMEYYTSFEKMNLFPTESGLLVNGDDYWFKNNYIHFRYKIKGRKLVLPWLLIIARSEYLINKLKKHDWLRRRAGIIDHFKIDINRIIKNLMSLIKNRNDFHIVKTTDFTVNSRILLRDLLTTAIKNGLELSLNNSLIKASKGKLKNILDTSSKQLVSSDFNHNPHSAIIDLSLTNVVDNKMAKVSAWYDNEWGFACRMCDLASYLGKI